MARNSTFWVALFTSARVSAWAFASMKASRPNSWRFSAAGFWSRLRPPALPCLRALRCNLPPLAVGATIIPHLMRIVSPLICRILPILLFCAGLLAAAAEPRTPQEEPPAIPLPVFEFHSGFWLNLHHTLYHQARLQRSSTTGANAITTAAGMSNLSPAEARAWNAALAFYAKAYADKDLTVSLEMILIKNQLGDFETCEDLTGQKRPSCDAGLPVKLTEALISAAPVYRAHLWPEHDRANRRWIAGVAPLVRRNGVDLSHRLAEIYQTRWPKDRIRVDVTSYASSTGAYTTLDPLRVTVSSSDARNQGAEALEVLFHESSHGIADLVESAIFRECRQRDKPIPRDLWHALLFYTTGEVIRPLAGQAGASAPAGYVPYAVREGLYKRGWENYLRVLTQYWQPYLDGRVDFSDAVAHMISAL